MGVGREGNEISKLRLTSYWFYRIITHLFQAQSANIVVLQITADNSLKYRQRHHKYITV